MMEDFFVSYLFEEAKNKGLSNCQLFYMADKEFVMDTNDSEQISNAGAAGFEAHYQGKNVSVYTESFKVADADYLIEKCIENASFLADGNEKLLFPGEESEPFESYDEKAEDIYLLKEKMIEFKELLKVYGEAYKTTEFNLVSQIRSTRVVNDKGLDVAASTSRVKGVITISYNDGEKVMDSFYYMDGNSPDSLNIREKLQTGIQYVTSYATGIVPKSGNYKALFRGETFSYLLMVTALFFAKDYVDSNSSRFRGKLGKKVASDIVTIVDNPRLEGGLFSVPFDSQGVPTKKRNLITGGILTDFLCDLETAEVEKGLLPGCSTRSRMNLPMAASNTNMYMEPGFFTRDELLEKLENGIFVTEVQDYFHRHGTDPATGDFSIPAKGFLVKDGKICEAAINFSIAGNLYDILGNVDALGNSLDGGLPNCLIPGMPMRVGGYKSPDVLVNNLIIHGKQVDETCC